MKERRGAKSRGSREWGSWSQKEQGGGCPEQPLKGCPLCTSEKGAACLAWCPHGSLKPGQVVTGLSPLGEGYSQGLLGRREEEAGGAER